jgi:hypothetical protein
MTRLALRIAVGCAAVSAAALVSAPSASASAGTTVLTCAMSATATFNPGVTLLGGTISTVGGTTAFGSKVTSATPCTSPTGEPFVGGTGRITGTSNLACLPSPLQLIGIASGTITVTWYNGGNSVAGHSTIGWSLTVSGPALVFTASVTSGDMTGSTVEMPLVVTGFNGLCGIGSPVVAVSFAGNATFLSLQ